MTRSSLIHLGINTIVLSVAAYAIPVHLRCEYLENPLGIDATTPHLSWQSDNTERDWLQTAYEILVATTPDRLASGSADVWDSGKRESADSVGIAYGGPKLESRKRYYWTVRVWDTGGQVSRWAEPAWWEMGLLRGEDWEAKWISWKNPEEAADRQDLRWIWVPGQDAFAVPPKTAAIFRLTFKIHEKPQEVALVVLAHGDFTVQVNGKETGTKKEWHEFDREDITGQVAKGKNIIQVTVSIPDASLSPPNAKSPTFKAGFAALLKITATDGKITRIPTGRRWQSRLLSAKKWKKATMIADLNDKRLDPVPLLPQPAALFRHEFLLARRVRLARLYLTALGSYCVFINGQRVGTDVLTPGFTDYAKRVQYQIYDVTSLLASGTNVIGAILGDGWFGSPLTWQGLAFYFLPPPTRLLAQMEIDYENGSRDTIITDGSWKAAQSPILLSQIYAGEFYDARLEQPGWDRSGFDDRGWAPVLVSDPPPGILSSQMSSPPRVVQTLTPKSVTPLDNGAYVFDMGQNMVGWVNLRVAGTRGTIVRLRFAERLNPDGSIYRDNLRNADATDFYVLHGSGEESFSPNFTFHGFRYVEVTGYPGKPGPEAVTGQVVSSLSGEPTGSVTTSSSLVSEMWSLGIWGQRGNFLSVPTDCPQRDERLGWMGDAGVFWRTGTYNFDIEAFSHKWMHDVTDAQTAAGAFANVSPDLLRPEASEGAPGWGDAGIIVPWTTWLQYGDTAIIEQNWEAMRRWMDYIQRANPDFIRKNGVGPNFGDWLAADDRTDKTLLATAYWALIAKMMSQVAHALEKENEASSYSKLVSEIRNAFQKTYIKPDGIVGTGTQTSYVVTLYTKLAPEALEPQLVDNLVRDIESRNWHLSTGFLGTPFILFVLSDHGRADVANRLLLNDTYPSWGYMVSKGATTWWERWNGDIGDPTMNSYNHYAFGSVMAWVYRYVLGIDTATDAAGFHEVIVHPRLDSGITSARGEYHSVYGKIVSEWIRTPDGQFQLRITVPANSRAKVFLPTDSGSQVWEDQHPLARAAEAGSYVLEVGAGSYEFRVDHLRSHAHLLVEENSKAPK